MSRGWKVTLIIVGVVVIAVSALAFYGLWVWQVRNAGWDSMSARGAMSQGEHERAAELYARAIARRPDSAGLHMARAHALLKADNLAGALQEYRTAADLEPGGTRALMQIAYLEIDAGRPAEAEAAARQAMARSDDAYKPVLALGLALASQDRHTEALEQYEVALDRDAPVSYLTYNMGQSHEALGDMDAAIEDYRIGADNCDQKSRARLRELEAETTDGTALDMGGIEGDNRHESDGPGEWFFGLFMIAYFGFILLYMVLWTAGWVACAYFLWDCAQRAFDQPSTRGAWCILLFIGHLTGLHALGAIVYYFAVYRQNRPRRFEYGPPQPTGQTY